MGMCVLAESSLSQRIYTKWTSYADGSNTTVARFRLKATATLPPNCTHRYVITKCVTFHNIF